MYSLCALFPGIAYGQIHFDNATFPAGVAGNATESFGASWGDLNGDGYPDLFIDNHRDFATLWLNNGNGTFTEITASADLSNAFGPNSQNAKDTHGSAWADFDNDGFQDLTTTWSTQDGHYMLSDGNASLTDVGDVLGLNLGHDNGSRQPVWFDANNDGLLDLKVAGTRENASNFFLQNANGTFTRVPDLLGITCPVGTQWSQLIDINASGTLELLCGSGGAFPTRVINYVSGNGAIVPFPSTNRSRDAVSGDFNNDGRQDIVHILGAFRLNEIQLVSPTSAEASVVLATGHAIRTITLETNGRLQVDLDANNWNFIIRGFGTVDDIYIGASGYHPSGLALDLVPSGNNLGIQAPGSRDGMFIGYVNGEWSITINNASNTFNSGYFVFHSDQLITDVDIRPMITADQAFVPKLEINAAGGFVDASASSGMTAERCISGVAADFDNDMDLDLFLACRHGTQNLPNVVFENLGGAVFSKVPVHGGEGLIGPVIAGMAGASESVISADYDADGFIDVFVSNGLNLFPWRTGGDSELFRNAGNGNNWLQIDLVGVASNRDGVGTKVWISAGGVTQYREQNGGYHRWSQNFQRIHAGLAANTVADVNIAWPSGAVDSYPDVPANGIYRATEDQGLVEIIGSARDSDGDGLSDDEERDVYGTDPDDPDTDNGGAGDGTEVVAGTDPLDPADDSGALPVIAIDGASAVESAGVIRFAVSIAVPALSDVMVDFATADDSAVAGEDYLANAGAITIPAGDTQAGIDVVLLDDNSSEDDETFTVSLSDPQNALLGSPSVATGMIRDDDVLLLSISDESLAEADGTMTFDVFLSAISSQPVMVDFTTVDGSATGGADFTGAAGQLTFPPGSTAQSIDVVILDDSEMEDNETFTVQLSGANNAQLGDDIGLGTIIDDELTSACGAPDYSRFNDRATFLWKDCDGSNRWNLRVTGGSTPDRLLYTGGFTTPGGVTSLTPFSVEASDIIDTLSDADALAYELTIYNVGEDGFSFVAPAGSCFIPELPGGLPVYLGADRALLQTADYDLDTGLACVVPGDSDNDGLTDDEENAIGTDPFNPDTDGGGASDGDEVDRGTDPLDADDDDSPIADLCGAPLYGASSDRGTFVWKDCDGSNRWHMRVTGGGVSGLSLYEGRIDAPGGLLSLVPVSIEASDVLDQASNPDALNYSLRVYNIGEDGFDFEPPPNACLRLNGPAGLPVFLGQGRVPLQRADLDLDNGGPCGGGPGGELPVCGAPLINDATDKEAFLWRNCSTGKWSARFNAGTSFTIYEGTIESAAGFTSLQGVSVEDSDTLTGSASDVFFNLRVGKTFQDGFDFTAPEGSDLCVDLDLPEGIDVLVGANRLPVTPPFDPLTLGACN